MRCKNCVGKVTTMLAGRCSCGNEKNSVYKYCEECSRKLGYCELCGNKLVEGGGVVPEPEAIEVVKKIKEKYQGILLNIPNVVGVGIGISVVLGKREGVICLRIYVEKDIDLMKTILAQEIEGVKVAVVEVGKVVLY